MFLNSFRFANGAEVRVVTDETTGHTHVVMPDGRVSKGPGGGGYTAEQILYLLNMISNERKQ